MRFEQFFHRTSIPLALTDLQGCILKINPALERVFGYGEEELSGKALEQLLRPGDLPRCQSLFSNPDWTSEERPVCEATLVCRDGSERPVLISTLPDPFHYGGRDCMVATFQDLTEKKETQARLHYLTYYDPLTALANRSLLMERLRHGVAVAGREAKSLALLLINIRRLKFLNDSFGHDGGDRILKEVAGRILQCVRKSDTAARYHGDKFALALEGIGNSQSVSIILRKVLQALDRPFRVEGNEIYLSAAIGIALFPTDGSDPETLLQNAETAMRQASEPGSNRYQYFTPEMNQRARERLRLESAIYRALEREEFEIYYQPMLVPHSGRLVGVEALLRWNHPREGLLEPTQFISLLEETGLIKQAGDWVLRRACRQVQQWRQGGQSDLKLAVNISARQFQDREFITRLREILAESGLPPTALELELTESVLMVDTEESEGTLREITGLGVNISVDDFGTGYSSLTYLKRFPVHSVKIDRSFICGIPEDDNDITIAYAIFSLAQNLGLQVIAEGVENDSQLEFLNSWNCQRAQGFLFAHPMPAPAFGAWWHERPAPGPRSLPA